MEPNIQNVDRPRPRPDPVAVDDLSKKHSNERSQLSSNIEEVRRRAVTGALRTSPLRSVAWAILLDVLPPDATLWLPIIRAHREKYSALKDGLRCDPRHCRQDDPLSQNDESMWNRHFRDAELQTTIKLDVIRTFPGVKFFKQPEIQEAMVDVLFCFARENPSLMYRQGMHEILAPLLFVVESDHKAASCSDVDDELREIMNPRYLEHDCYTLFNKIMASMESFYRIKDVPMNRSYSSMDSKFSDSTMDSSKIEIDVVHHLELIKRDLSGCDPELYEHLQKCDISLTLFGIRWLRVLFGREFSLHDLLFLWDAIFAEGDEIEFARYVMLSMLIAIRTLLIENETMVCLTYLMHYPTTIDVQYVIDYALYLKYPDVYSAPVTNKFCQNNKKADRVQHSVEKTFKSEVAKEAVKPNNHKNATSSVENVNIAPYKAVLAERDNLKDEVMHARNVMSLCKLKLEQYVKVVEDSLPSNLSSTHPAYQALGGIRELCTLLQSRHNALPDVEIALEADEAPTKRKQIPAKTISKASAPAKLPNSNRRNGNHSKSKPSTSQPKELVLYELHETESDRILGAPSDDPLGTRKD